MLWHKVIKSKYGRDDGDWWPCRVGNTTFRSPWKAIRGLVPVFLDHAHLKLGNGRTIKFWEDAWEDRIPLKVKYPSLFRLCLLHNKPVSEFLAIQDDAEPSWDLHLRRNVTKRRCRSYPGCYPTWRGLGYAALWRINGCGIERDQDFSLPNPSLNP